MSYRSIKRYLGETNLERKCRLLFGVSLLLLIGVAFWLVDSIAETLVKNATRSKGRDLVETALLKKHFNVMDETTTNQFSDLANSISSNLLTQNYETEIITLESGYKMDYLTPNPPEDEFEQKLLKRFENELKRRYAADPNDEPPTEPQGPEDLAQILDPGDNESFLFDDRSLPGRNEYHYFVPIQWDKQCFACHAHPNEVTDAAFEGGAVLGHQRPLHAVKLVIPYKETQTAIYRTRAVLIAVWIFTVFVAMIGLYVIVRYVIVKPLKHLRDTSDDISRGKTELRAELYTGDEFEELADSFNRMVVHLTDTQAMLKKANWTLDSKVDELALANMRLHEMNQLKNEFLANMSHELRTPLNSIIGFSEVLRGIESLNDKQQRYAENIQKSGRVLLEMINDILDLAKMEAGKMELRPSEFDIAAVVSAHCDMVRALSEEKNIDLEVHVDAGIPAMYQDQAKVQQILTNLLSNAIKFTPEGGRITVSVKKAMLERIEVFVEDTGVGIADEDQEIVFEKFRQAPTMVGEDSLTREFSGTGLGLSIVKELCKLLGGEVSLESELGKGSKFTITLPVTCKEHARHLLKIESKLDEIARPPRGALRRNGEETPIPPPASSDSPNVLATSHPESDVEVSVSDST